MLRISPLVQLFVCGSSQDRERCGTYDNRDRDVGLQCDKDCHPIKDVRLGNVIFWHELRRMMFRVKRLSVVLRVQGGQDCSRLDFCINDLFRLYVRWFAVSRAVAGLGIPMHTLIDEFLVI